MLRSVTVENFRAFKNARVELGALNIFVGPNNSGKSSIISAVSLIAQNCQSSLQRFSLALNGPHTQLGTFYDVVHGHSARSSMTVGFAVDEFQYAYTFRYRPARREIELVKATITNGPAELSYQKTRGLVTKFRVDPEGKTFTFGRVRARFSGFNVYFPLPLSYDSPPTKIQEGGQLARRFVSQAMMRLNENFRWFDSVGAFRVAPERTYYFSGEAYANIGKNGENYAQILASSSPRQKTNILSDVSLWFVKSGIAKNVQVRALTNRHFELLVEDTTGSQNNITDSGFGCSQVMPVLAGGYQVLNRGPRGGMYVVQEPEIHLHPTAAAQLGTFFVDLAKRRVQCLVETHSENIVLRVARLVAEGELKASDVRIFWVSGSEGEHKITNLGLKEDGTFTRSWPEGFFPTRAEETLQLARAASTKK